jgi:hypothetical protein
MFPHILKREYDIQMKRLIKDNTPMQYEFGGNASTLFLDFRRFWGALHESLTPIFLRSSKLPKPKGDLQTLQTADISDESKPKAIRLRRRERRSRLTESNQPVIPFIRDYHHDDADRHSK